ncbi:MAG: hypothetical protein IIU75_04760 [Rikenellaceae bacterium]|nr:hypothetical protein [Alistipes sp.]MBQ5596369.1 hypothetical protein [Rikenellaceae bacterium]
MERKFIVYYTQGNKTIHPDEAQKRFDTRAEFVLHLLINGLLIAEYDRVEYLVNALNADDIDLTEAYICIW